MDYRKITKKGVQKSEKLERKEQKNIEELTDEIIKRLTEIEIYEQWTEYCLITDAHNGEAFARIAKDWLCYVPEDKSWYEYQGGVWKQTNGVGLYALAFGKAVYHLTTKNILTSQEFLLWQPEQKRDYRKKQDRLYDASFEKRLETVAKSYLSVDKSMFDADLDLLNLKNGTYNLKTKRLQKHNPEDYIMQQANVSYKPRKEDCVWEHYLDDVTCGDAELKDFLQIKLGATLSGKIHNEEFQVLYGATTRNGKSTLVETVGNLLGTYATSLNPAALMTSRKSKDGEEASPEMANLAGKRYIGVSEAGINNGTGTLDIEKLKQLTGQDTISARQLYGKPFKFTFQGHIFMNCNSLASIPDSTIFDSDRCNVIPFNRHFSEEEADDNIKAYFRLEDVKSAILNWLIEGYQKAEKIGWKAEKPQSVIDATSEYREAESAEELFLKDCLLETESTSEVPFLELLGLYFAYYKVIFSKKTPLKRNEFYKFLANSGISYKDDHSAGKRIVGYKINEEALETIGVKWQNPRQNRSFKA